MSHSVRVTRRRCGLRGLGVAGFAGVFVLAGSVGAQNQPQAQQGGADQPTQTLLVLEAAGAGQWLPAEKDAGLLRALSMVPDRVSDLRKQVPEFGEVPPAATDLLFNCLSHSRRLAVTNKGFDPQTGMPGFGLVLSFGMGAGGEADAQAMHKQLESVRSIIPMGFQTSASKRFPGMTDLPLPLGVLSYGPRKAADGWRYELLFAAVEDPDAPFKSLPAAPTGVTPVLRASLDLAAWSPIVQMVAGFAAAAMPGGATMGTTMMEQMRASGLTGPDAMSIDVVSGYAKDYSVTTFTMHKAGKYAERMRLPKQGLAPDDLNAIPADATAVLLTKIDLKAAWAGLKEQVQTTLAAAPGKGAVEDPFADALARFKSMTAVDLEQDVVAALGTTYGIYLSDSTGGGSIFSGVLILALADPARFSAANDKLAAAFTKMAGEKTPPFGTVELARFEAGGVGYTQLRFPGLPVPLEPTYAIAGNWLVVGATPHAAMGAARHIKQAKAGSGLSANPAFAAAKWVSPDPTAITFIDTGRTMAAGYPVLSFATSAIANAVRTPSGAGAGPGGAREPGLVMPLYAELREGARPMLWCNYWKGDDLVTENRADRSMLVSFAGLLGVGDLAEIVGGGIIGAAIGAKAAQEQQKSRAGRGRAHRAGHDGAMSDDGDQADHDADDDAQDKDKPEPKKAEPKRPVPY